MTITGKFNTDAKALNRRIQAHNQYGTNDLNQWIFNNLNLDNGMSVLELGCGTGNQSLPIAKIVGNTGHVLSIDLSREALDMLSQKAVESGLDKQITTLCCRHDDIQQHLKDNTFDRVLSSYSLYYSHNSKEVIKTIWTSLKPGGVLFFCGPSNKNNYELKKFHYSLQGVPIPPTTGGAAFMEDTGQRIVLKIFGEINIVFFENPLRFNSVESLYDYWSAYNLYEDGLADSFRISAIKYFAENSYFETNKRVVGVKARK